MSSTPFSKILLPLQFPQTACTTRLRTGITLFCPVASSKALRAPVKTFIPLRFIPPDFVTLYLALSLTAIYLQIILHSNIIPGSFYSFKPQFISSFPRRFQYSCGWSVKHPSLTVPGPLPHSLLYYGVVLSDFNTLILPSTDSILGMPDATIASRPSFLWCCLFFQFILGPMSFHIWPGSLKWSYGLFSHQCFQSPSMFFLPWCLSSNTHV